MNKYKIHILLAISLTVCIIALIINATHSHTSFDIYWHIATGRDYLYFGDSPFIDHFSFTHYGETIKSNPVVFQIIITALTSAFGLDAGLTIFKMSVFLLFFITLFFFYKTNKVHTLSILASLPFIIFFLMLRGGLPRPEILSYVFLITVLVLYFNAIREFNNKNLLQISILLIIWVNYHSAIIGYVVISGLFFEKGINKIKRQESFSWYFFRGVVG